MARVKLEDVCERGSSNLKQSDVVDKDGDYPIYGASGYIGNVDFYHQEQPYVAVVKYSAISFSIVTIFSSMLVHSFFIYQHPSTILYSKFMK